MTDIDNEISLNTRCADCSLDTIKAHEWYMVHDHVWERAWGQISRGMPGDQILCIGCLENRIGRRLTSADFTDAPVNEDRDDNFVSDRMFERLKDWC
jgi:hypothetical protein